MLGKRITVKRIQAEPERKKMKYRELGNTGLSVSEIGMGCEGFAEEECRAAKKLFDEAEKQGINYFDLYTSNPQVRASVGEALKGRREKFYIQSHVCSVWKDGQYKRTRNIQEVKKAMEDMLVWSSLRSAQLMKMPQKKRRIMRRLSPHSRISAGKGTVCIAATARRAPKRLMWLP